MLHMIMFVGSYARWHYGRAYYEAFAIWMNLVRFVFRFFNIGLHTRTLFTRFYRLGEEHKSQGFDIGDRMSVFLVNMIMRIVGAVVRTVVIAMGLCVLVVVFMLGVFFFIAWTLYPVIVLGFSVFGIFGFFI